MALQGETTNREFRHESLISLFAITARTNQDQDPCQTTAECLSLRLFAGFNPPYSISKAFVRGRRFVSRDYRFLVSRSGGVAASISRLASL